MKSRIGQLFAGSVVLSGLLVSSFAPLGFAQVIPGGQQDAGQQTLSPTEYSLPADQRDGVKNKVETKDSVDAVDLTVPDAPATSKVQSPKFFVSDIEVTGVTMYDNDVIEEMVQQYENKEMNLEELGGLVDALNQLYRSQGYLTSQAYIPPQDIEGGKVRVEVLEGRLGDVTLTGNKYYKTSVIERNIHQKKGDALNIRELEESLNRVNQREDFRLKAVLSPGEDTGSTDLRLEAMERQPWQIATTMDNQGRPFIGYYRYGAEISNQNVSGRGDRAYFRWIGARGDWTNVYMAGYALPLNRHGTELSYNFAYSRVNINDLDVRIDPGIKGTAANHSVLLSQPLDKNRNWTADIGFNARNISSYIDTLGDSRSSQRTNRDSIYSLQTGLTFDKIDRIGRTFVRGQVTWAPDWGIDSNRDFTKYEVFANRMFRLPKQNLLILRGNAQFTPDGLPSAEQFQVGGAFSVRGYSEGLVPGDRGWNVGVEDRFPVPFLRHVSPYLADRVQGAVFADFGQAWIDQDNRNFVPNTRRSSALASVGVGFRGRLNRYMQGFVDMAWGLVDHANLEPKRSNSTMRVHFGIRSEFLPNTLKVHDTGEPEPIKVSKADRKAAKKARKAAAKAAKRVAKVEAKEQQATVPVVDEAVQASAIEETTPAAKSVESTDVFRSISQYRALSDADRATINLDASAQ